MNHKVGDQLIYKVMDGMYVPCEVLKEYPNSDRYRIRCKIWERTEERFATDYLLSKTKNEGIDRDIAILKKQIDYINGKIGELMSKREKA